MRGVVADQRQRIVATALGDDLERRAAVCRRSWAADPSEIAHLAADLDGQRGASQPGTDRRRGVGAGGASGRDSGVPSGSW